MQSAYRRSNLTRIGSTLNGVNSCFTPSSLMVRSNSCPTFSSLPIKASTNSAPLTRNFHNSSLIRKDDNDENNNSSKPSKSNNNNNETSVATPANRTHQDEYRHPLAEFFGSGITPWDSFSKGWPSRLFRDMRFPFDEFERDFFDFPVDKSISGAMANWTPKVDVSESENTINVHADIPGINKEDIKVKLEDDILTISGERKSHKETEDSDKKWKKMERSYGTFIRRMQLPPGIDKSTIKAKYQDGVLNLEIQKPKPAEKDSGEIVIE